MNKKWLHMIAFVLVIVGGVNWGIFGFTNVDVVQELFGGGGYIGATIAEIIYVLIAISAIYLAVTHTTDCKICSAK